MKVILGFKLFKQRLTYAMYDSLMEVGHKYRNLVGKKRQKWPQMFFYNFVQKRPLSFDKWLLTVLSYNYQNK